MDDDMEIEIIEVEEPEEPVPMQDCCLQVSLVLQFLYFFNKYLEYTSMNS